MLVPIFPEPDDNVSVPPVDIDVDAASVIAPDPVVVSCTLPVVALTLPATFNPVPDVVKFTASDASVEPFNVTTAGLPVPADESVIVTAAVVFAVSDDADDVRLIVPDPDDKLTAEVFVSVIVDVPLVLSDNVPAFVVI